MNESAVHLLETGSGEMVEAVFVAEVSEEHLEMWSQTWLPIMKERFFCRSYAGPEDAHWNWKAKAQEIRGLLKYEICAVVCRQELQGLMLINNVASARLKDQFGKPLIYVEFLSTAPWNRPELKQPPRYRGVGSILIAAAIQASLDAEFKGRIGLHSLPKAEVFYEHKCGMTRLGFDSSHEGLLYFEMTPEQAAAFRRTTR